MTQGAPLQKRHSVGLVLACGSNKLPGEFSTGVSDILDVRMGPERGLADQPEAVTTVQEIDIRGWTQW